MKADLGRLLRIRATAYVAGEPVPYYWPMRTFISRNPLGGFEDMPFAEAVEEGAQMFGARTFLSRRAYQEYLAQGLIDHAELAAQVSAFVAGSPAVEGIALADWATCLLEEVPGKALSCRPLCSGEEVYAALHGTDGTAPSEPDAAAMLAWLRGELGGDRPLYEAIDLLFGTDIGSRLDELVIRACLDFFDEGQSVWSMPHREEGLFAAWRAVADGPTRRFLDSIEAAHCQPGETLSAEQVIDHVLGLLGVPEDRWTGYFSREVARLYGWSGFIRWRASAKRYYWAKAHPGDLVDLLALRLTLGWTLIERARRADMPCDLAALDALLQGRTQEMYLRLAYHRGEILPANIGAVDAALSRGNPKAIAKASAASFAARRNHDAREVAARLRQLGERTGELTALQALPPAGLISLIDALRRLEASEGMIWLRAMEAHAMRGLLGQMNLEPEPERPKRPFVQAAFCIDTRSERIRRHLENVGDYQTFGIAGFFGVPVSLIELGRGSEKHLCPVLLTPKNLVLEMVSAQWNDAAAFTTLQRVLHELKESIISPFVTVEAVGLLFGFDMIGKTLAPEVYNRWRKRMHNAKPNTHLLLDKLTREQADSIVRAVQRAVIIEAVEHELGLPPEDLPDAIIRDLREIALGNAQPSPELPALLKIDLDKLEWLIERLQRTYRINSSFGDMQMEHLGRVGFGLDEQVEFVAQALSSIGLTENFSRFVLIVGHMSTSENNPYESALDCGACGGNDGMISARVLAQMANKHAVRRRLKERGIDIPDDAWFIPALHNTTTDEITLHDLELLPTTHLVYLDRLRSGLTSAARLCAQERMPSLAFDIDRPPAPGRAISRARRNALDWSQVRPEWGLSGNAYFVIGRRKLTQEMDLSGRSFLHSYDYRLDSKRRLLENILTGPLVVAQWINLEYYFSVVDNDRFGSGSKVYHNVAGQFGVMTGNLSDLRTGLPAQTVLDRGKPFHQPLRLITVIEAPFESAKAAIGNVVAVKTLVNNGWIRLLVADPVTGKIHLFDEQGWVEYAAAPAKQEEAIAS